MTTLKNYGVGCCRAAGHRGITSLELYAQCAIFTGRQLSKSEKAAMRRMLTNEMVASPNLRNRSHLFYHPDQTILQDYIGPAVS
jgi:hypothetical protein